MKIPVGISNRHVHLTEEVKNILFGNDYKLSVRRELKQTGEYASESIITIKGRSGLIENVRVIGPLREYTQVEVLESDKELLGINPPVRNSADLINSETLTLIGPSGEITLDNVCIIANRHIHMNPDDALKYNLNNEDIVKVKKGETILDNVFIKIKDNYVLEFQINKDDALANGIEMGDEVELINE